MNELIYLLGRHLAFSVAQLFIDDVLLKSESQRASHGVKLRVGTGLSTLVMTLIERRISVSVH